MVTFYHQKCFSDKGIFTLVQLLLNDSHVALLAIIAIQHLLIHLFKTSKDKERVHYGINL